MKFTLADGDVVTLAKLEEYAKVRHDARRLQKSMQRQPAGRLCDHLGSEIDDAGSGAGQLRIDWLVFVGHQNRDLAPLEASCGAGTSHRVDGGAESKDAGGEAIMSHDRPMPARPADDAPFAEKCHWLALTYGYCALTDTVVELYEPSDECQLKPAAFQRLSGRGARSASGRVTASMSNRRRASGT